LWLASHQKLRIRQRAPPLSPTHPTVCVIDGNERAPTTQ